MAKGIQKESYETRLTFVDGKQIIIYTSTELDTSKLGEIVSMNSSEFIASLMLIPGFQAYVIV